MSSLKPEKPGLVTRKAESAELVIKTEEKAKAAQRQ